MTNETLLQTTQSLCPHCLQRLPADIISRNDTVFLRRECPEHGIIEEIIWRGEPDFRLWKRPKTYNSQFLRQGKSQKGCPFDCGLCSQHLQKSCAVLYELTDDCNLRCPVCFAASGDNAMNSTNHCPSSQTGEYHQGESANFAKQSLESHKAMGCGPVDGKACKEASQPHNRADNKGDERPDNKPDNKPENKENSKEYGEPAKESDKKPDKKPDKKLCETQFVGTSAIVGRGLENNVLRGESRESDAWRRRSERIFDDTIFAEHRRAVRWIHGQAGQAVLQLSGGEPTLSPYLVPLVREAGTLFSAVQLNTNGILLATDDALAFELAEAGLSWVFLQFDGIDDNIYERLRGHALFSLKQRAIEKCKAAGLAVVLVPTVAKGVNDHCLGEIVRFGIAHAPTVRGVHFQPMTRAGRNLLQDAETITLPEVLQGLEVQTGGMVKKTHASPPGCEHERCSFHCRYTLREGELVHTPSACCCGDDYDQGLNFKENTANKHMENESGDDSHTMPRNGFEVRLSEKAEYLKGTPESSEAGADRAIASVVHNWQRADSGNGASSLNSFDAFIARHRATVFSVTCMAFQDVWNIDLERLQGCCIHIYAKPDRLVPFCAYNLTDKNGTPLYRGK